MLVFESTVNWLAILVAVVANMALGFSWHSMSMFGKEWIALMGWDIKKIKKPTNEEMTKSIGGQVISAGIMAWMLSVFAQHTASTTWILGMQLGFLVWLGFIATVNIGIVLWERKPCKLFAINTGYWLVSMLIMGAIIGGWQ